MKRRSIFRGLVDVAGREPRPSRLSHRSRIHYEEHTSPSYPTVCGGPRGCGSTTAWTSPTSLAAGAQQSASERAGYAQRGRAWAVVPHRVALAASGRRLAPRPGAPPVVPLTRKRAQRVR